MSTSHIALYFTREFMLESVIIAPGVHVVHSPCCRPRYPYHTLKSTFMNWRVHVILSIFVCQAANYHTVRQQFTITFVLADDDSPSFNEVPYYWKLLR